MERNGLHAAIAAYLMWGLLTVYWKQLEGLDALELIAWRVATSTVLMVAIVTAARRWRPIARSARGRTGANVLLAAIILNVNWWTYVWAVVHDRVIETALGYFLAPLATMALGVVVLREHLTPLKWASIVFALAAVAVLTFSYGQVPWAAVVLAATWSLYGLLKRQVPLDAIDSLTAELMVLFLPALAVVIAGFARPTGLPHHIDGVTWAYLIGTGLITAVPLLLFSYAAKRVPFTILGPINYLVPLINFLLGWLVFDEPLPQSRVIGFLLVWVALALATVDMWQASRRDRRPGRRRLTPVHSPR